MEFRHTPVLLEECIENLNIRPEGIYVDGTLGGAGHSSEICSRLSERGLLIGIDRDQDALDAAGISEDADTSGMNPSALLKDADLVIVPQKKAEGEAERISINTADVDELCKLSGIGPSTAERIIEYRNENGLFQVFA